MSWRACQTRHYEKRPPVETWSSIRESLSLSVILAREDWETSQIPCGPLKSLSSLPLPFLCLSLSAVVTLTPTLSSLKKTRFFNSPAERLLNALMYDREKKREREMSKQTDLGTEKKTEGKQGKIKWVLKKR